MAKVLSLKELKKTVPMEPVMIRVPHEVRELARAIVSESKDKITETDVYRTAILMFLEKSSTKSRNIRNSAVSTAITEVFEDSGNVEQLHA